MGRNEAQRKVADRLAPYGTVCPDERVHSTVAAFMCDNVQGLAKGPGTNGFRIMCTALGVTGEDAVEAVRFMTMEGRRAVVENGYGRSIAL